MARDDHETDHQDAPCGKPDQRGQDHHAPADRPDHLQEQEVETETPGEADQRELEEHEPKASSQQPSRETGAGLALRPLQVNGNAGQEHEHRCAEMRDPAGREQHRIALLEIERIKLQGLSVEEVADVVERHQGDDQTPQDVD